MPRLNPSISLQDESLVIRNIRIFGRRTSVRLEELEWAALDAIAWRTGKDLNALCEGFEHDPRRREKSRTSRIRMGVLQFYIDQAGLDRPAAPKLRVMAVKID